MAILELDDIITEKEVSIRLDMQLGNVKRMRKNDPDKYKLLALGIYVEKEPVDILVATLEVVNIIANKVAIDRIIREHK